jgi:hypothetical protein
MNRDFDAESIGFDSANSFEIESDFSECLLAECKRKGCSHSEMTPVVRISIEAIERRKVRFRAGDADIENCVSFFFFFFEQFLCLRRSEI